MIQVIFGILNPGTINCTINSPKTIIWWLNLNESEKKIKLVFKVQEWSILDSYCRYPVFRLKGIALGKEQLGLICLG